MDASDFKISNYRPDIDGLRAIAIIPVVLYHAGIPGFSGGYVGVDVFFVVSGYLIAGLIYREIIQGNFSLMNFYERRARRILPALFTVLAVTLIVGWLLSWAPLYDSLAESVLATVLFSSNIYFWQSIDYFAVAAEFRPLLHTWSLAVEEQFYLLFPLFMFWLVGLRKSMLSFSLVVLLLGSLALSVWGVSYSPVAAFYLAPTRAWELLLGVILALKIVPVWRNTRLRNMSAVLGLTMIAVSVIVFDSATPFPGLAAILPCAGTALVIQAGRGHSVASRATTLLSHKTLVFVGLVSYSFYLWHWPILAFLRVEFGTAQLPAIVSVPAILASFVLAVCSWRFIERPFRIKGLVSRHGILAWSGASAAMILIMAGLIVSTNGLPARYDKEVQLALAGAEDQEANRGECFGRQPDDGYCIIGDPEVVPSAVFWGDSHSAAMMSAMEVAVGAVQKSAYLVSHSACPPLLGVRRSNDVEWRECHESNVAATEFILEKQDQIDTVLLVARWPLNVTGERSPGEGGSSVRFEVLDGRFSGQNARVVTLGLRNLIDRLRSANIQVVLLGGVPEIGWDVPMTVAKARRWGLELAEPPTLHDVQQRHEQADAILRHLAQAPDVEFVPVAPYLCRPECIVLDGDNPVYVDTDHLSAHGARVVLGPMLADGLAEILNSNAAADVVDLNVSAHRRAGYSDWNTAVSVDDRANVYVVLNDENLNVVSIKIDTDNRISTGVVSTDAANDPGHSTPSIAVDGDGYVHVWYDMHNDQMRLKRSALPYQVDGGWLNEFGPWSGGYTYPAATVSVAGDIYFAARSTKGWACQLFYYPVRDKKWQLVASFARADGFTCYLPRPYVSASGKVHISFQWRRGKPSSDRHLGSYAVYDPQKDTFHRADGSLLQLPITPETADVYQPLETNWENTFGITDHAITVSDLGYPVIAYNFFRAGRKDQRVVRIASWDGAHWVRQDVAGPEDGWTLGDAEIVNRSGRIRVFYKDAFGRLVWKQSNDNGVKFGPTILLMDTPASSPWIHSGPHRSTDREPVLVCDVGPASTCQILSVPDELAK